MKAISCNGKKYSSEKEAIIDLYKNGNPANRIAGLLGCSETTVYNRLKEAGVPRRRNSGKETWKRDMRRYFGR